MEVNKNAVLNGEYQRQPQSLPILSQCCLYTVKSQSRILIVSQGYDCPHLCPPQRLILPFPLVEQPDTEIHPLKDNLPCIVKAFIIDLHVKQHIRGGGSWIETLPCIVVNSISHYRFCFTSASSDKIKIWKLPDGNFLQNFTGHQALIKTLTVNSDNVLVSGGIGSFTVYTLPILTLPSPFLPLFMQGTMEACISGTGRLAITSRSSRHMYNQVPWTVRLASSPAVSTSAAPGCSLPNLTER